MSKVNVNRKRHSSMPTIGTVSTVKDTIIITEGHPSETNLIVRNTDVVHLIHFVVLNADGRYKARLQINVCSIAPFP